VIRIHEGIAALFFNLQQIPGHDGKETALIEVPSVDAAGIYFTRRILGTLDQKRAADQNLAAGATTRAFPAAAGEKLFIACGVDTCPEEAANLPRQLPDLKAKPSHPGDVRQTTSRQR